LQKEKKRLVFPFTAIVNLNRLKLAMLINAINPRIGGVLIRGPKGSGKSTIVRSLADILPTIRVIKNCPFNCDPSEPAEMCPSCREEYGEGSAPEVEERKMTVVDLPLGATEDRVIGSLDVEKAIKLGIEALEPGILAEANQNILYVDEVNLLPDHIADDLLDTAATGWNIIEREGISVSHPSRFIFIGTMNPEEGELRPQLLDRFPLSVSVENISDVNDRMEIVKRNLEFEADPERTHADYSELQDELQQRILEARKTLVDVKLSDALLKAICNACLDLKVDGVRPDIIISKAAKTLAAFEKRSEVNADDTLVAAQLALGHRTREGGFVEPASSQEIGEVFTAETKKVFEFKKTGETTKKDVEKKGFARGKAIFWTKKETTDDEQKEADKKRKTDPARKLGLRFRFFLERIFGGTIFGMGKKLKNTPEGALGTESVQTNTDKLRGETYSDDSKKGKIKGYPTVSESAATPKASEGIPLITGLERRIVSPSSFFLTMGKIKTRKKGVYSGKHAKAVTTLQRGRPKGWKIPSGKPSDIHLPATIREASRYQKSREKSAATALNILVEDIRENTRTGKAPLTMMFVIDLSGSMMFNIEAVREALLKLHSNAYRQRDKVGIVALKGLSAEVVQHPTSNLRVVANRLVNLKISGYTPLAAGMYKAWEILEEEERRNPSMVPVIILVTDGSANVPLKKSLETGEIRNIEEMRVIVREYEDLAVRDVISVSKMLKRKGIHTISINTNVHATGPESYGLAMTNLIANLTNGTHHSVGGFQKNEMVKEMIQDLLGDQRTLKPDRLAE
jgi:magnesium chelatase subunit D